MRHRRISYATFSLLAVLVVLTTSLGALIAIVATGTTSYKLGMTQGQPTGATSGTTEATSASSGRPSLATSTPPTADATAGRPSPGVPDTVESAILAYLRDADALAFRAWNYKSHKGLIRFSMDTRATGPTATSVVAYLSAIRDDLLALSAVVFPIQVQDQAVLYGFKNWRLFDTNWRSNVMKSMRIVESLRSRALTADPYVDYDLFLELDNIFTDPPAMSFYGVVDNRFNTVLALVSGSSRDIITPAEVCLVVPGFPDLSDRRVLERVGAISWDVSGLPLSIQGIFNRLVSLQRQGIIIHLSSTDVEPEVDPVLADILAELTAGSRAGDGEHAFLHYEIVYQYVLAQFSRRHCSQVMAVGQSLEDLLIGSSGDQFRQRIAPFTPAQLLR